MGTLFFPLTLLITLSKLLIQTQSTTYWQDIEALKEFKYSINQNSIKPSTCLATWDFSVDPCDHLSSADKFTCGISCSLILSGLSRVTEIALDPDANYSGSISSLTFNLPYLQTLDLSYNSFSGSIPGSVLNLTRAKKLGFSHNSFSGIIPDSTGSLSLLEELFLDYNNLEGKIPKSLNRLKNLKRLEVQNNRLSDFPELNQLENLYYLDASENLISGDFPSSFPPNLIELAMRSNQIQGNVPSYVCNNMVYLQVLDLSHNQLSGLIPSGLFTHPSLQQISLAYNNFGSIQEPGYINTLSTELIAMDLSNNDIHGILPAFIGLMPRLSSVSFENNKISGFIPTQYALKAFIPGQGLARFERLLLGGNYLFGPIPGPFISVKDPGSVMVSLGDNCLYRCPVRFFFCTGGVQKSLVECKSFVPVIP